MTAARIRSSTLVAVALVAALTACSSGSPSHSSSSASKPVTASATSSSGLVVGAAGAKAVLDVYEDPACTTCVGIEQTLVSDVRLFVSEGGLQINRHLEDALDAGDPAGHHFSLRADNALLCAGDEHDVDAVTSYVGTIFGFTSAGQPIRPATGRPAPTDAQLVAYARAAGVDADSAFTGCVTHETHAAFVQVATQAAKAKGLGGDQVGVYLNGTALDLTTVSEADLVQQIGAAAGA
ncbi:MAG: thioredoxin domain-containing protein [Actinobacteria bacterium]|nr:thioredoxin domain-containing protein [Actinomycetota bacterium]